MLAAYFEERNERLVDFLDFFAVFLIGIFQFLERACRIHKVAGVDSYLVGSHRCRKRRFRVEVDVGNERLCIAVIVQALADDADVFRFAHSLSRQAHIVGPGIEDALALCDTSLRVEGGSGGHRLYADRVVTAKRNVADFNDRGFPSDVVEAVHSCNLKKRLPCTDSRRVTVVGKIRIS